MAVSIPGYPWPVSPYTPYGGYMATSMPSGGMYPAYRMPAPPLKTKHPDLQSIQKPAPKKPHTPAPVIKPVVPKPPAKLSLMDQFFVGTSYAAVVGNIAGGIALLSSNLSQFSKPLRAGLKKWGLVGIAAAVGIGCLSEMGVGLKQKQPTVTLSNTIFLLATPLFVTDTPFVRGLFLFLMGAFYAGFANIVGNKYERLHKGKVIDLDAPLTDIPKNAQFIVDDHKRVLSVIGKIPSIVKGLVQDLKRAAKTVAEGNKLIIEPSADRIRLSALCHYIGGAMLMMPPKRFPWMAAIGSLLAGIGGISNNLEWFAVGTQRDDGIGTALKIGMPMQALGKMLFHTNIGYGTEIIGQGLSYALSVELNQEESKPH